MNGFEKKSLKSPDETRTFDKGRFGLVHAGDVTVGLYEFGPGWRWSESVKPIVGTESCQNHHVGYVISGRLGNRLDDGTEEEFGPGDVYVIPPGHDGWVVGDEPFVGLEWKSAETYAAGVTAKQG